MAVIHFHPLTDDDALKLGRYIGIALTCFAAAIAFGLLAWWLP